MLTKEEVKELLDKGWNELVEAMSDRLVPKSDEIRELVCSFGIPDWAYGYAVLVDDEPKQITRDLASKDAVNALQYAIHLDKKPTEETRNGAMQRPYTAYLYASMVDKSSREDTKKASSTIGKIGKMYELWENSLKKI